MKHSVILGATTGAGVGALTGLAYPAGSRGQAAAISAAVGAVIGSISGYALHKGLENRDADVRKKVLFNLENHGISKSSSEDIPIDDFKLILTSPKIEEDTIETHVKGNQLIQSHRVWTLTEGSKWDLSLKPKKKDKK